MILHNAVITGSLTLNGTDIGDITGSEAAINALNIFSSSIYAYTASNDTTNTNQNNRLSALETTSGSLLTASGSFSTRVTNTETTASNLTVASSSFSTRVTNNEATGSNLVAASASFSTRVANTEATASSLTTASGSFSTRTTNLETASGSFSTRVTTNETNISNLQTASGSFSTRITDVESSITSINSKTGSYATTGSNAFNGNQTITGSLTVTGQITAQTLNVQQVTSSIIYSSGSNIFGNSTSNTQQFTGSLLQSGSLAYFAGSVGVGTISPSYKLDVLGNTQINNTNPILYIKAGNNETSTIGFTQGAVAGYGGFIKVGTGLGDRYMSFGLSAAGTNNDATELIRIDDSGNVGIGTSSPDAVLAVHGQFKIRTTNADGNESRLFFNPGGAADPAQLYLYNEAQSNTIYVTANGASYFNGGNVGIGTTSPTVALDVVGTGKFTTSGVLPLQVSGNSESFRMINDGAYISWYNTANNTRNGYIQGSTALMNFQVSASGDINFGNGTDLVRIKSGGNVGIGTISPSTKLHLVNTDADAELRLTANNTGGTEYDPVIRFTGQSNSLSEGFRFWYDNSGGDTYFDNVYEGVDTDPAIRFRTKISGTALSALTITHNGYVGIGTTAPSQLLHLQASGGPVIRLVRTSNRFDLECDNNSMGLVSRDSANAAFYFNGFGNVGVGVTTPEAIFHVAKSNAGGVGGQVVIDNNASSTVGNTAEISFLTDAGASGAGTRNARILAVNENAGNGAARLEFHTWNGSTSAVKMTILSGGNVGINTTNPTTKLYVAGTSTFTDEAYFTDKLGVGTVSLTYKAEVAGAIGNYWNGSAFTGTPLALSISNTTAGGYDPVLLYRQTDSGGTTKLAGGIGLVGRSSWTAGNNGSQISDMYFLVRNDSGGITERMRITSAGNLYINPSSPNTPALLTIKAAGSDGNQIYIIQSNDDRGWRFRAKTDGHFYLQSSYTGADTDRFMIKYDDGNVGIGTTSPGAKLTIYNSDASNASGQETLRIMGSYSAGTPGSGPTIQFTDSSGGATGAIKSMHESTSANVGLGFFTISTTLQQRLTILANGNVGIGTGSPLAKLHIDGNGFFRNPGTAGYTAYIGSIAPGNTGDRYLHVQFNTIGSMMLWIKVFGYVYTTNVIEGLGGGYVGGGTGGLNQAFQNGAIVAQYQNSGYVEIVVDTVNTSTTNRWGSITFLGGTDNITTIQPLEIRAYSWTSTTTRVY